LANDLYTGETPIELKDLTSIEQVLIALARVKCNIYKINTYSSGNVLKFRGNIITFPQTPIKLLDILPNIPTAETIQILFIGTQRPKIFDLKKLFNVRRDKVKTAIEWLIKNNHLYKNCRLSNINLLEIPIDGVPQFIIEQIEIVPSDDTYFQAPKSYTMINSNSCEIMETDPGTNIELDSYGLFETTEAIKLDFMDTLLLVKQKMNQGANNIKLIKNIITIPHGENPLSEINNPDLLISSFPHLFPYAIGGFYFPERKTKLSAREHINYLFQIEDLRYQHDKSFKHVIFNQIQRAEARKQIFLMLKRKDFRYFVNEFKFLTIQTLESQADNYRKTGKIDSNSIISKMFSKVHSASVHVQGSKASLFNRRLDLKSYIIKFGTPMFYITINPADVHNPLMLFLANEPITLSSCSIQNAFLRMNIVKRNPIAQAKFFDLIIKTFISEVLCFSINSEKEGILGKVDAYYGLIEAGDRGAQHAHFLQWIKTDLSLSEMGEKLKCENFHKLVCDWTDSLIKSDLDDFLETETIQSNIHPCCRTLNLDLTRPINELDRIYKIATREIVSVSQQHKCSFTCKNDFTHACRFHFPQELVEKTLIDIKTGKIDYKRSNPNINWFIPLIIVCVKCNIDTRILGFLTKNSS
jgi:hypothetical protein